MRNGATSQKVAGSISDAVFGIFIDLIFPASIITEMCIRNISWGRGKAAGA
jgi:hypothetical protein